MEFFPTLSGAFFFPSALSDGQPALTGLAPTSVVKPFLVRNKLHSLPKEKEKKRCLLRYTFSISITTN